MVRPPGGVGEAVKVALIWQAGGQKIWPSASGTDWVDGNSILGLSNIDITCWKGRDQGFRGADLCVGVWGRAPRLTSDVYGP